MSNNYSEIIAIAELMKRYALGAGYDVREHNDDILAFKLKVEPKIRIALKHTLPDIDTDQVGDISEGLWTISDWTKYKKIYELQPTFADFLADTESAKVSCELWKRLPYESFYLYFGDRKIDPEKYGLGSITMNVCKGAFVRVHVTEKNIVNLGIEIIGNSKEEKWMGFVLDIPEGMNFNNAIDYYVDSRKGIESFDPQRVTEIKEFWKPFFRIIMNACQYFSASNAEIKDVKVAKKDRPVSKSKDGKEKKVNIKVSQVGYSIGQRFEQMYRQTETSTERIGTKGTKKRPHVRRAHWHHYWTGPGRTVLEVKWLEPVFVMGEEDMKAVVHRVEGA